MDKRIMEMEERAEPRPHEEAMPFGARIAKAFLDLMTLILILPMIWLAPSCLFSLGIVVREEGRSARHVLTAAAMFLGFEAFLGMSFASFWMVCLLRSRYRLTFPESVPPNGPLLDIVQPMALTSMLQASLAILMWLGARSFGHSPSWVWLSFWLPTGLAAWAVNRWVSRAGEDGESAS
ncbi:hypothetical protein [Luteolibacter luteus]|uniref:Uncharacterized protein n=1 Tax=Luteolibacter luteus TaxID=2728835 RepID=A0A858RPD8_9BACT|nr:hypothetical protein [Luteolibacter luteus]QJE97793.1 hypothetical protein HHL09_19070 [Luteolibacter luteus]